MSRLDVPNCFKDFLWLATVGVCAVYAVPFFIGNNVMKGFLSWCFILL